ncbi:MAG: porin, partial [Rhodococcus sp. (in: high G+C Gram-positive bacteria)]
HANITDLDDDSGNSGFNTRVRARLDFDAREETELGTLRAKVRVQATNRGDGFGTNDAGYGMDEAYIQLGGLTVGYLDSLWAERDGLFTDADWSVGDYQQNRISYTYTANGFSAALSLEDDGTGDFVPDVVAQLAYEGAWGEIYASGVYDEQEFGNTYGDFSNEIDYTDGNINILRTRDFQSDSDAFAIKAGVTLKDIFVADSQFKVEGHYATDPTEYAVTDYVFGDNYGLGVNTYASNLPSEYQIGAGYQQQFGKVFAAISGVYGKTFDLNTTVFNVAGVNSFNSSGADYYGGAVNLGYQITTNLSVLGEVSYRDVDLPAGIDNYDQTGGFLELKRTF